MNVNEVQIGHWFRTGEAWLIRGSDTTSYPGHAVCWHVPSSAAFPIPLEYKVLEHTPVNMRMTVSRGGGAA